MKELRALVLTHTIKLKKLLVNLVKLLEENFYQYGEQIIKKNFVSNTLNVEIITKTMLKNLIKKIIKKIKNGILNL